MRNTDLTDQLAVYAEILTKEGVQKGLIGPREPEKLWERHLLNCAAISHLPPESATVVDVGTGAGLPGLVVALLRPDVEMHLVEPMKRRVEFLEETVPRVGVNNVWIHRGRAEDFAGVLSADAVLARAVAPLERLLPMTWNLIRPGGSLLAMKGESAEKEIHDADQVVRQLDADTPRILYCDVSESLPPVRVIEVRRRVRGLT